MQRARTSRMSMRAELSLGHERLEVAGVWERSTVIGFETSSSEARVPKWRLVMRLHTQFSAPVIHPYAQSDLVTRC
jgi:hypothetical protein